MINFVGMIWFAAPTVILLGIYSYYRYFAGKNFVPTWIQVSYFAVYALSFLPYLLVFLLGPDAVNENDDYPKVAVIPGFQFLLVVVLGLSLGMASFYKGNRNQTDLEQS